MITIGEGSAVVVTRVRTDDRGYHLAEEWRTIFIAHILEFQDLPSTPPQRKRKRA